MRADPGTPDKRADAARSRTGLPGSEIPSSEHAGSLA